MSGFNESMKYNDSFRGSSNYTDLNELIVNGGQELLGIQSKLKFSKIETKALYD